MKILFLLVVGINFAMAEAPNFQEIFRQIQKAKTSTESILVREKHLSSMRHLYDFNRLTNLEKLSHGEEYFDHYKKSLGEFVVTKVDRYMLDAGSDREQDIFARHIVGKAFTVSDTMMLLEKGLFYVEDCEDFISYARMAKAPMQFTGLFRGQYCTGSDNIPGQHGNVFELISNVDLKEGEFKQIYLPSQMYIKKLYISVEGIYNSAYFDIMINGDIKGTIYAPGRDPLYIINVADSTNVINLRSMSGSARILSIKVEY